MLGLPMLRLLTLVAACHFGHDFGIVVMYPSTEEN